MEIYIDPNKLLEITQHTDPFSLLWFLFIHGGWLVALVATSWQLYFAWLEWRRRQFLREETKYTVFAIDIPRQNEQTVKAVEEIFNSIHGIKSGQIAKEKWLLGQVQLWFSLEIISIEGYIQFLVRTPSKFNDVIKSAFYARYSDAEIIEVEDYMNLIPRNANDLESKFKGFGMDFSLGAPDYLPIKTYMGFEHSMSQTYIDPLASILELMGKLGPGEFMGILLMLKPVDGDKAIAAGRAEVGKMMGRLVPSAKNWIDKMLDGAVKGIDTMSEAVYELWGDIASKDEKESLKMLTPGERAKVTAIETKTGKFLYECKLLTMYIAPKEKFSIARAMYGLQGSFRQFADFNQFKNKKTKADYIFKVERERKNVQAFIKKYTMRDTFNTKSFLLSTEEVASLYHFPDQNVKAPMIKKTETKTVEPPTEIPFETKGESILIQHQKDTQAELEKKYIEKNLNDGSIIDLDLDSKYFESKFAKNKDDKDLAQKVFQEELREENVVAPISINPSESDDFEKDLKPPSNLPFTD